MHKYNGLYKLRNGIVVEAWPQGSFYTAPVKTVSIPDGLMLEEDEQSFAVGIESCLRYSTLNDTDNPLTWVGGSFGSQFDVVEFIGAVNLVK